MAPALMYRDYLLESPTKPGMPVGMVANAMHKSPSEHPLISLRPTIPEPETYVAVVGVGFVGESLLREFSRVFPTIGYDISPKRIAALKAVFKDDLHPVELTTDSAALKCATHILISVPTLLRHDRSINLDFVESAVESVLALARPGSTIVLESSVSVGTTRRLLGAHAKRFHIGMSPERVDPGRKSPAAHQIPKIISGLNPASLKSVHRLYSKAFETVVPVSSTECAEMTKLFENSFRMVNIAYVNEMSDLARRWGIDPAEMVDAAATKPYGFMKFAPGLGVGGHCIPVNPYYLFQSAGRGALPVLERATTGMWARPRKMARKFYRQTMLVDRAPAKRISLNAHAATTVIPAKRPRLLVVGVGFKPGQKVLSCSPGLSFAQTLRDMGCSRLTFHDPLVDGGDVPWMEKLEPKMWCKEYVEREFDGVAVCSPQEGVDFGFLDCLQRTFVRSFVWAQ